MQANENDVLRLAKNVLAGESITAERALELAKALKTEHVGYARRILDLAACKLKPVGETRKAIVQQRALCTYKDPHLTTDEALDRAFEILQSEFDLSTTEDQESLGLAGAIFKRKWEVDGLKVHLERALQYYNRGYQQGVVTDQGYTAINAAFVENLLASTEEEQAEAAGAQSNTAAARRDNARRIRREIVDGLGGLPAKDRTLEENWWFVCTLAEAYFGLEDYDTAAVWLDKAKQLKKDYDWEYESTARQLGALAQLLVSGGSSEGDRESPGWKTLYAFLGENANAVRSVLAGKVGLALSGGGFRASFYHIGVLAKLAELDLLRHVEVLSCVSGGSILGAHYYLELRRLFNVEKKKDSDITREDYIKLVERLADDFLAGVQRNVRVRVAASPIANLKMIFFPGYSRTERLGELYESEIYSAVKDGEGDAPRWMKDLYINPVEKPKNFSPRRDNWVRHAKVPMLILNATTLNTGHNWQFTASWMGEPPASINPEVDGNDRLRRMYYGEAPHKFRNVRLGHAVAASSCVPGLFEPICLQGLYLGKTGKITVRLVDGGVHDNQGIASLLEQDCSVLLASDASGQMNLQSDPGGGVLKPLLRTNSVLQARLRDAQYAVLKARRRGSLLRGLMFVHLKQDLDVSPVNWETCEDPEPEGKPPLTGYGIRKDIQELLAGIRTDLDSFNEVEAYALMTSGYKATEKALQDIKGFSFDNTAPPDWKFLKLEPSLRDREDERHPKVKRLLEVASSIAFKVWKLSPVLKSTAAVIAAGLIVTFAWLWWQHPGLGISITVADIGWAIVGLLLTYSLGKGVAKLAQARQTASRMAVGAGMGVFGWLAAWLHLSVFDQQFMRHGKVDESSVDAPVEMNNRLP